MKVLLDRGKCQGYGNCVLAAPDVFDLDESGFVTLIDEDPAETRMTDVKRAVLDCPVSALAIEE